VATETDAARDRVLAARAALGEELENLEASVRTAVDVPAKIRRSPAKAAAIAGGAAFLVLGGPKRVFRAGKRAVTGEPADLPESMLPDEIEKTLRKLGDDGEKVRGALERDFAAYAKKASQDRRGLLKGLALVAARPLLSRAARAAAASAFGEGEDGFRARLEQIRERTRRQAESADDDIPVTERAKAAEERAKTADDQGTAAT
jgi:hypothetical protein